MNRHFGFGSKPSLKNFLAFVYFIAFCAISLSFMFSALFGEMLIPLIRSLKDGFGIVVIILMIIASFIDYFIMQDLLNFHHLEKKTTSNILTKILGKTIVSGFFLSIPYLISKLFDSTLFTSSLIISLVTFLSFAIFVFVSKKDFSFTGEDSGNFARLITFIVFLLLIIFVLQFIIGFFNPGIAHQLRGAHIIISLFLSLIFVVVSNARVKKFYEESSYIGGNFLVKVGFIGSLLILDSFVSLFIQVFRLLSYLRKRRD